MEKSDPYSEWALGQNPDDGSSLEPVDQALLVAARSAWPRVLGHATGELGQNNSRAESEAIAAEIWTAVLKAVARAFERKADGSSSIIDLQGYLFSAFHHRFNRFLKKERRRHETIELVSSADEFEQIGSAQDLRWATELDQAITIQQVIGHMDEWTRKAWQARQSGYSWKEIAKRFGLTEQQAKMRFQYGLKKTRQSLMKRKTPG